MTAAAAAAQQGSIRGVVFDKDFDGPLGGVRVYVAEAKREVMTTDEGNFVIAPLAPGTYTLTFSKQGYVEQARAGVVVAAGSVVELEVWLAGDFTELEEFIVQDVLQLGAGTDAALLQLRFENPALMNSISADLMSQAGASDAASALKLISGASVQDGKFAVVRGLPDRYVSSQLNGVRLPSADAKTRAVELDQFPSAVIDSISVTKTFTPDQQGDASGGAVNVRLRGIPEQPFMFRFRSQVGYNSNIRNRTDFLSYEGGGVTFSGKDGGSRAPQLDRLDENWDGAAGTSETTAPIDSKFTTSIGLSHEFENGLRIGTFASYVYERDSSFYDDGIDDSLWMRQPLAPLTPQFSQGTPEDPPFLTKLFDVTRGTQSMQRGGLITAGASFRGQSLMFAHFRSRSAEDTATLAVDTRGKQHYFPDFDPTVTNGPGNDSPTTRSTAPYIRQETLEYTERITQSQMLRGDHVIPTGHFGWRRRFEFDDPKFDWTLSTSSAEFNQPDKRQFAARWFPEFEDPGLPPFFPPTTLPARWTRFQPAQNINLGNFQRIFKKIEEDSDQYALNLELPFEQWSRNTGYFKFGWFEDKVDRRYDENTYANFGDVNDRIDGEFEDPWSRTFPFEDHAIGDSELDVDYLGRQKIQAWYAMVDMPLFDNVNVIGGVRRESTEISTTVLPEQFAVYFPPGINSPESVTDALANTPELVNASVDESDYLPSIGLVVTPVEHVTVRLSYSETIARQTFRELTPILQQEFLGGPIFVGNAQLQTAELDNYDARIDYTPFEDGLLSVSYFKKDVTRPIEFVQRVAVGFDYTTAVNYPDGELEGWEFEARQDLGQLWAPVDGLMLGGNMTLIDSEVTLDERDRDDFDDFNDMGELPRRTTRNATNAPKRLYNLFATYDVPWTGTRLGAFYTVTGDTLIAGAGIDGVNYVPDVWAKEFDTLNLSVTQRINEWVDIRVQAKNVTDPEIETEYRAPTGENRINTSFTRGIDYTLAVGGRVSF